MSGASKPDYGIDGWAYMAGLLAGGAAVVLCGLAAISRWPTIGTGALILGTAALVPGLWGLYYVRIGKFRHRDRLLAQVSWRGDERSLDVGTGGGLMLIGAARRAPRGSAVGIDIWNAADLSGNAPARVLANAALEGVRDRIDVQSQDARAMSFDDGEFDAVFSVLCLHNVEPASERMKAVREIVRVLKPGGGAVISDLGGAATLSDMLREAGLHVEHAGPFWDTFPPQHVVVGTKERAA